MKNTTAMMIAGFFAMLGTATLQAQVTSNNDEVTFAQRNMGGPRIGVSYVYGGGKLVETLGQKGIGRALSQFGWHFEYQVIPEGGGPSFVIQLVPMVAGVEYGTLIPSGTLAMGVRFMDGFEFGMGPNLLISTEGASTSLVIAIGKSFNYGGVSIPLNLVYATNPDGNRVSFVFGYSIAKGWK